MDAISNVELPRVFAPDDSIDADNLKRLITSVRSEFRGGILAMTIDLSRVTRMNARLLAAVLLLIREGKSAGVKIDLSNPPEEFLKWASTFGVLAPLQQTGILGSK